MSNEPSDGENGKLWSIYLLALCIRYHTFGITHGVTHNDVLYIRSHRVIQS